VPTSTVRSRRDLCPGVLRPWPAEDGALVRLRLVGGRIAPASLRALSTISQTYGDGDLHLTGRANLQLRALPTEADGSIPTEVVDALEAAGVLPSRSHELVRNIMVSPQSGLDGGQGGGQADLRPVADELDRLLVADQRLAQLPGRFLFVLDDGRGDLVERTLDLGLVALDAGHAQLRVGSQGWGPVLGLADAAAYVVDIAHAFLDARGRGRDAPWHVDELDARLHTVHPRDPRTLVSTPALAYGEVPGGTHVEAPGGVLAPALVQHLTDGSETLVVTGWHGVLVPGGLR